MNKTIKILVIILTVSIIFAQDSYALWGKKKASKTPEPEIQKEESQVKKVPSEKVREKEIKQEIKEEVKKEEKQEVPEQEIKKTPVMEKKVDKKVEKLKEKLKLERNEKREQINNTQWNITLNEMGGKGQPNEDVLIFEENRFYAEKTSKAGFNATNYTISVQADGMTVWETMQTAEEGRINFWRGEIAGDMKSMKGIVSKQLPDGITENYSFLSREKK
ncbi:MAG: hypothetical protein KAS13_01655 [Candidatus Omnitrophica bacterium]|nr:hypothetical protein [Candidatus Omnitrophota bacterium]